MATTVASTASGARPSGRATPLQRLLSGDNIAYAVTFAAAASVLVITAMLVLRAVHKIGASAPQIRLVVSDQQRLGSGRRTVRRAAVHLRDVSHLRAVAADRGSARRRSGDFPGRAGAAEDLRRADVSDRAAGGGAQRDHRAAGNFRAGPDSARRCRRMSRTCWAGRRLFSGPFYGFSLFSAGVVLSIMIVPFIISVSREVILAVPNDQREAALALGATRWETTWDAVVPFAQEGHRGLDFSGPGARAGRNHGGDHGGGQRSEDPCFAAGAGILHRGGDRQ